MISNGDNQWTIGETRTYLVLPITIDDNIYVQLDVYEDYRQYFNPLQLVIKYTNNDEWSIRPYYKGGPTTLTTLTSRDFIVTLELDGCRLLEYNV